MEKRSKSHDAAAVGSGAMAVLLHASRVLGLAPIRFVKNKDGWRISLSLGWSMYGNVMTVLNSLFFISFFVVGSHDAQLFKIFMHDNARKVVWLVEGLLMMFTAGTAVFTSPRHMRELINILVQVQKLNSDLDVRHFPNAWSCKMSLVLFGHITLCMAVTGIQMILRSIALRRSGQTLLVSIFGTRPFYYFAYWVMQVRNVQFIAVVLLVKHSFKMLNDQLKKVLENLENEEINSKKTTVFNNYVTAMKQFENKNLTCKVPSTQDLKSESPRIRVRRLALKFARLCNIVREVDRSQGFVVLLILASTLLHLVPTPYFLIRTMMNFEKAKTELFFFLALLFWCFSHIFNLVMTVEPCDRTYTEIERTRKLVGHLMRCSHSSLYSPLTLELDQFFTYLQLNDDVSYRPVKFTTLTRSLVVTILGTITTYVVIFLRL